MEQFGWDRETSPYHSGEQELQNRLGRLDYQDRMARKIHRPYMPEQHQDFYAQLPLLMAGSVDPDGWPWASVLFGQPGFITTPTDRRLSIGGGRIEGDPFWTNAVAGAPVGFLGIELPTRRRNRVNGVVKANETSLDVDVVQSYGNCPQYIHTRSVILTRDPQAPFEGARTTFTELSPEIAKLIEAADTFFVASNNPHDVIFDTGGVDVSHRGGNPGFVKVDGNILTVPDYIGNFAFNTLGNFLVNPKAGLLFINFSTGDLMQLTGTVEVLLDVEGDLKAFRGAERAWRFHVDHGHVLKAAAPMTWDAGEPSPNTLMTGDWGEAIETRQIEADLAAWRPFKVSKIVDESSTIRSFYLEPDDGKVLLPFKPGQFLTLRVEVDGSDAPLTRTYTLSSAPSDLRYRISVKRDGVVSRHLHDQVIVGDVIETQAPRGAFWIDLDKKRPAVLLAGGVGVTPMMSMVRQALNNSVTRRHHRDITVIHAAQSTSQRAFAQELNAFQTASQGALRYVSVISRPVEGEAAGRDFHVEGHVNQAVLQSVLALADDDFYLCRPSAFTQAIYDMLVNLGVRNTRIFAESFGPASLNRTSDVKAAPPGPLAAEEAVVTFATSQIEQGWKSGDGTLLEFAESHGLAPAFGCRSGKCGSCAVKMTSGQVSYTEETGFQAADGEVLICCAIPANSDDPLILEL